MKTTVKRIGIAAMSCLALSAAIACDDDTVVADAKETAAVAEAEPWYGLSMALGDWHLPADRHRHVYGLYIDPTPLPFYGEHYGMTGLSVNLFAGLETKTRGIQISGLFGYAVKGVYGIQLGGLSAITGKGPPENDFSEMRYEDEMCGWQAALLAVGTSKLYGVQTSGFAAVCEKEMYGVQIAPICYADRANGLQAGLTCLGGELSGIQIGLLYCAAGSASGLQVGFFNYAEGAMDDGVLVQIGLLNIIGDARTLPILNVAW